MTSDELLALFPEMPAISTEEVHARFAGVSFTHSADERLHFTLLAPPGWTWRLPSESPYPAGLLLSLVDGAPGHVVAEIAVAADELPREVSPAEWVRNELERRGHAPVAQREQYGPLGAVADLLTRTEGPGGTFLARTNMVKDGPRLFTLTCQAREDVYPARAGDFFATLASFHLLHPEKKTLAEPLAPFCELYPSTFGFSHPASWRLVREAESETACDVRLDNVDGDRCAGRIFVQARAGGSPRAMMPELLARIEATGVVPEGRPPLAPCDPPEGFVRAFSMVTPARRTDLDAEVRVSAFESEGTCLLLGLSGPARSLSSDWWAINKRAFEIVCESAYVV